MSTKPPLDGRAKRADHEAHKSQTPSLFRKLRLGAYMYSLQTSVAVLIWIRSWVEWVFPPPCRPDIVKTYKGIPRLPVRVFLPTKRTSSSRSSSVPTLFTIHGGGFCLGTSRDDDEWNRSFADKHGIQVVSLSYSKAPRRPFPTALHNLEALYLAVIADASLPTDNLTALLGFSAGGNLALALSQLPTIKGCAVPPRAVTSVYGCLDLDLHYEVKLGSRPYKPALSPPRNSPKDALLDLVPVFDWSYIPYGHDLRDPLLSPTFAPRAALPPYVCLVAAELDMLAHEAWRLACRLANEERAARGQPPMMHVLPDAESAVDSLRVVGREQPAGHKAAALELDSERFAWEETRDGSGIKWLLVPDVTHGFDNVHIRGLMGGKETIRDAEAKTAAYCRALATWLLDVVWAA